MRYKIKYHYIMSDHLLAIPELHHSEIVDAATPAKLRKYVETQKDQYGHKFKKADKKNRSTFGFDYTSNAGGIKVEKYKSPKVKKI